MVTRVDPCVLWDSSPSRPPLSWARSSLGFGFWSHRAENIVCTHHGTDIQINSTGCCSLHRFCQLSSEFRSPKWMCSSRLCTPCLCTVFRPQWQHYLDRSDEPEFPLSPCSSPQEHSRSHGCLCLPVFLQSFLFFFPSSPPSDLTLQSEKAVRARGPQGAACPPPGRPPAERAGPK